MLKIENVEVTGWEAAIRGMRNPMNSWGRSDSWFETSYDPRNNIMHAHDLSGGFKDFPEDINETLYNYSVEIGPDDHRVMMLLAKEGSVDAKYRRMINVTLDITAPLYWWKEFDAYKVGTVANSCSTMHKIHAKEFTLEDFSCEHLFKWPEEYDELPPFEPDISYDDQNVPTVLKSVSEKEIDWHYAHGAYNSYEDNDGFEDWVDSKYALDVLIETVEALNHYRSKFLETKDKRYWWQLIQLLPSSYNQRRTVQVNYEVLAGIYPKRKDHKLDEWHTFCDWIKTLPYSEIITLEE